MDFPADSVVKNRLRVQSWGREDPLEKEMAIHFSILAWKIVWTEEPGGTLQRVRHNLETKQHIVTKLNQSALHLKLTHHYKSTILQ